MNFNIRFAVRNSLVLALFSLATLITPSRATAAQQVMTAAPATKPVIEEWVYRTKYGFKDEWWALFKKYQIAILERQKQLGYVKDFTVYAPSLHTSEEVRWDYRIIIIRASADAPPGQSEAEVAKQLFPDQATFKREENRRWELTTNHWDLPIHVVNPDASN
ncbi:hypothetical protein [Granulicella paludicola]|jgi:hypothetical protein|uniref:hypothetical protein n=1 Tax=Granulicella paludicola TaxID=474951 RepID=UPI0021E046D6|nr:hypothetical protein [Granulicella paludicola]